MFLYLQIYPAAATPSSIKTTELVPLITLHDHDSMFHRWRVMPWIMSRSVLYTLLCSSMSLSHPSIKIFPQLQRLLCTLLQTATFPFLRLTGGLHLVINPPRLFWRILLFVAVFDTSILKSMLVFSNYLSFFSLYLQVIHYSNPLWPAVCFGKAHGGIIAVPSRFETPRVSLLKRSWAFCWTTQEAKEAKTHYTALYFLDSLCFSHS